MKLTPQEQAQFAQVRRVNPDAYDAYLRGRYHWMRRPVEFVKAIQWFQLAIAKDPTYAAAYSGLADCFSGLNAWGSVPASEGCVKAKALAEKAVELDPGLGEAHASLAYAAMYHFDFQTAEREFERSLELNPRSVTAHQLYGWYLGKTGRYEEAYTELQRAIRLDPLSSIVNAFVGYLYFYGRRYDEAIEQSLKTIQLDPQSGPAYGCLAVAYRYKSLFEPAISAMRQACALWPGSTPLSWFAEILFAAGCVDEARKILEQLLQSTKQQYVTPYGVARIYATLGDKDKAFEFLETGYEERAQWMVLLKVDPGLDTLRGDPRFEDLLRRMNFPQ